MSDGVLARMTGAKNGAFYLLILLPVQILWQHLSVFVFGLDNEKVRHRVMRGMPWAGKYATTAFNAFWIAVYTLRALGAAFVGIAEIDTTKGPITEKFAVKGVVTSAANTWGLVLIFAVPLFGLLWRGVFKQFVQDLVNQLFGMWTIYIGAFLEWAAIFVVVILYSFGAGGILSTAATVFFSITLGVEFLAVVFTLFRIEVFVRKASDTLSEHGESVGEVGGHGGKSRYGKGAGQGR